MNSILCAALMPHPPIIIPKVGKKETAKVCATIQAMDTVAQSFNDYNIQTIIIISPHGLNFADAITLCAQPTLRGTMAAFGAPDLSLEFKTDEVLLRAIQKEAEILDVKLIEMTENKADCLRSQVELDHGAFVPLYYLHKAGFRGQIIHLSPGFVSYEEMITLGQAIQKATATTEKRIGIVASGDLSHRVTKNAPNGFHPQGAAFNQYVVDILRRGNLKELLNMDRLLAREIGECGLRPIFCLMGILDGLPITSQVLSYEAPFGVGYAVAQFDVLPTPTDLARASLVHFLKTGQHLPIPRQLPPELTRRAGTFVSLKKANQLRGCIGTIFPTEKNTAKEIIENAIRSGTEDPRFTPVELAEVDKLTLSVDILGEPESITSEAELDVTQYGVIVKKGNRTGLLLPRLAGVDTVREQIDIARQKAGIAKTEDIELYRFTVTRYE